MKNGTMYGSFIARIKELISNDDIETSLRELKTLLENSPLLDEVIQQSGRYSAIRKQIRQGIVDHQSFTLTQNQIRLAILDLLNEIEASLGDQSIHQNALELREEFERTILINSKNIVNQSVINAGRDIHLGDKITHVHQTQDAKKETEERANMNPVVAKFFDKIQSYLKTRYESRLRQKLANRQPVNLRRLPSDYGTSAETSELFIKYEGDEIKEELEQCFKDSVGRMLIIGMPGTGKTTLLLQLALKLLESESDKLTAVVNLATWKTEYHNLNTWLQQVLPAELGVSKKLASQLIEENILIFLFDGFDEIKGGDRFSCLSAIGNYGIDAQRRFVISSRKDEYALVRKDAPVNLQIEVGLITIEQLEANLRQIGHSQPEALRILQAIKQDEILRLVIQTPFYLNIIQLLFADKSRHLSEMQFLAQSKELREKEILEFFIKETTSLNPQIRKYTGSQAIKGLSFLAAQMNSHNIVTFELLNLQWTWFDWSHWNDIESEVFKFLTITFLFSIITFPFLILELLFTNAQLFEWLIVLPLFLGLHIATAIVGALGGMIKVLANNPLSPIERERKITVKGELTGVTRRFITRYLPFGILIATLFVLLLWLIWWLFPVNEVKISLDSFTLTASVVLIIVLGAPLGVAIMIDEENKQILQIANPYQRFLTSVRSFHFSVLKHFYLRWLSYRKKILPFQLVYFLDSMVLNHLLESDETIFKSNKIIKSGAAWRFRHRILQDYFASKWEESETKN